MANLPVPSSSSGSAPVTRPAANGAARGKAANDSAAAAADENPFQTVLALELGLVAGLPGQGVASTAAEGRPESGAGAEQTAAMGDTPLLPGFVGVLPFPPPGANVSKLPVETMSASTGRANIALDPRLEPLQKASGGANAESALPTVLAAADFAVPGKFMPATESPMRREAAFDTSLLEHHQAPAAAAAPIHGGGSAPSALIEAPGAALQARVGSPGWDRGLGDRLVWMAGQRQQVAQLHLTPPELGPLQITLTLDHDQASAQFVSAHALVRDALEAAMPRLREMLADSGIALGDASVSSEAFREQAQPQPQHEPRAYAHVPGAAATDAGAGLRGMQALPPARGLVDTFA